VEVLHGLDAHANPGMAHGGQKELCAVIMGTVRVVTSPTGHLIEFMEK